MQFTTAGVRTQVEPLLQLTFPDLQIPFRSLIECIPQGRFSKPEEAALLASYLALPVTSFKARGILMVDSGQIAGERLD